jgi:hypothetical protein
MQRDRILHFQRNVSVSDLIVQFVSTLRKQIYHYRYRFKPHCVM